MKKLIASIPYENVKFRWVSNHYDVHLHGTCTYEGDLCEFEHTYPEYDEENDSWIEEGVRIYKLGFLEKLRWRRRQFLFEQCVGYHWTYNDGKRMNYFYYRNPLWLYQWLFKIYYKKKGS